MNPGRLTSFHWGSLVSLKTRVLALLTKYPKESTSRVQYRSTREHRGDRNQHNEHLKPNSSIAQIGFAQEN